jgi:hypothetical protein
LSSRAKVAAVTRVATSRGTCFSADAPINSDFASCRAISFQTTEGRLKMAPSLPHATYVPSITIFPVE